MTHRAAAHDYTLPGFYHITLNVEESLGQVLGAVVGNLNAPDGSTDAPHIVLSPIGQMVEHELLHVLTAYYPMVHIDTYAIMPEHLHLLLEVKSKLHNREGKPVHLGQVIAGYKYGCTKKRWLMEQAKPAPTVADGSAVGISKDSFPPLFAPGYCDVMPVDAKQLATQRQYIHNNPRSRMLRMQHPEWLHIQRGGIDTALSISDLHGYLLSEDAGTPESLAQAESQLLQADGKVACDTYGNRAILTDHRCLPVVCHRRDVWDYYKQKTRCLEEAAKGAVLVSARIAKGEREIMDEAVRSGYTVVLIADNGFTDRYHPSADRMDLCAEGRMLMITPWQYKYRPREEKISVSVCKTMNCLAQALCRTKDSWWQEP